MSQHALTAFGLVLRRKFDLQSFVFFFEVFLGLIVFGGHLLFGFGRGFQFFDEV